MGTRSGIGALAFENPLLSRCWWQGLTELDLSRTEVCDVDAVGLAGLCCLRRLRLDDQRTASVGDATLKVLAALPDLAFLSLKGNCELTERGLRALASAPRLSELHLSASPYLDVGLALKLLQVLRWPVSSEASCGLCIFFAIQPMCLRVVASDFGVRNVIV